MNQRAPRKAKRGISPNVVRKMYALRWQYGVNDRLLGQRFGYSTHYVWKVLRDFGEIRAKELATL